MTDQDPGDEHTRDVAVTDGRIERAVARLKGEVEVLRQVDKKVAEARRFKRGPFDFTRDHERKALATALLAVIRAFE